jgi:hypothetical protein
MVNKLLMIICTAFSLAAMQPPDGAGDKKYIVKVCTNVQLDLVAVRSPTGCSAHTPFRSDSKAKFTSPKSLLVRRTEWESPREVKTPKGTDVVNVNVKKEVMEIGVVAKNGSTVLYRFANGKKPEGVYPFQVK